jgi:hypothetical protein
MGCTKAFILHDQLSHIATFGVGFQASDLDKAISNPSSASYDIEDTCAAFALR